LEDFDTKKNFRNHIFRLCFVLKSSKNFACGGLTKKHPNLNQCEKFGPVVFIFGPVVFPEKSQDQWFWGAGKG